MAREYLKKATLTARMIDRLDADDRHVQAAEALVDLVEQDQIRVLLGALLPHRGQQRLFDPGGPGGIESRLAVFAAFFQRRGRCGRHGGHVRVGDEVRVGLRRPEHLGLAQAQDSDRVDDHHQDQGGEAQAAVQDPDPGVSVAPVVALPLLQNVTPPDARAMNWLSPVDAISAVVLSPQTKDPS